MPSPSSSKAPSNPPPRSPAVRQRDAAVLGEVLTLPAEHLTGLPLATRFILEGHGFMYEIVWSTEPNARSRDGQLVFAADEVRALVTGVQAERLWSSDLKGYCLRKLHDSSFVVTEGLALGGAQPDPKGAWSLGRVLRWLDLELVAVEVGDAPAGAATGAAGTQTSVAA